MRDLLALATRPSVLRRALAYAVIVGPVLVGINHGDALLRGEMDLERVLKMGLTFLVPYAVSTFSSVQALRDQDR